MSFHTEWVFWVLSYDDGQLCLCYILHCEVTRLFIGTLKWINFSSELIYFLDIVQHEMYCNYKYIKNMPCSIIKKNLIIGNWLWSDECCSIIWIKHFKTCYWKWSQATSHRTVFDYFTILAVFYFMFCSVLFLTQHRKETLIKLLHYIAYTGLNYCVITFITSMDPRCQG